ncbi:non-ribosomal peptide synthetase [Streptomyces sp. JJ38]|uniref:non-ribosomal peptide synthetase n=1 Tax=Streptomyces sp. JJ38 TaxID=2738128 RepID=UPI001C580D98|nr:non-ribosomal peptide synthetase [Streptomyces sp. JJ38]MBW1598460.1 amino acid adenylation domain-containing protein [Streptomyces sp. JJ38]
MSHPNDTTTVDGAALAALLDELAAARVRLSLDGEELRVSAAKGALTPALRDRLREHKPGLLAHLRAEAAADAPIRPLPRDGRAFPLSAGQEALWLLDHVEGHQPTYVLSGGVRLTGPLRTELLLECLNHMAGRHEALRTAFRAGPDGTPEQLVLPEGPLPVQRVDLTHLPEGERDAAWEELARTCAREPFDLAEGRLLRAVLATTGPREARLAIAVHHIAADASALSVFFRELFRLYEAEAEPTSLPPLSVHHVDVAEWQRRSLSPATAHRQLAYWRERLSGAAPLLDLPGDRSRPARQSYRGAVVPFTLDAEATTRLGEVAAAARVTPYVLLITCWAAVLARHAAVEDIVVGTPVSNRERPEAASVVGFSVGTLPLRVDLSGDPSFTGLLQQVQSTFLEGFENRGVPFQQVVAALSPDRSLSHAPVFQNMLTYYESPFRELRTGELTAVREDVHNGTAKFDLTLFAEDQGDRLVCSLEYAEDLFDAATAERLAESFRTFTDAALSDPGRPVSTLPLLGAERREEVLRAGTGAARPVDLDRPVHRYVTEQAARRPEATALVHGDQALTYAELDAESDRLAALLRRHEVTRGTLVGLYARRSVRQIVAMLAVLKAGGAFLPLDPDHPVERTAEMLDEARCPLVLADTELAVPATARLLRLDTLPTEAEADAAAVEADAAGAPGGPEPQAQTTTDRDDLMYVIYTSGSTGRPKGIAMRHGALANLLAWQTATFPFAEDDRVLQFSPLHFDVCMQEAFGAWAAGATLVLVDQDTRRDALRLLPFLHEQGVTRLFLPFVALQQLAEVAEARGLWPVSLRDVFTAGEQLHVTGELRAFFRHTGARLHNQYGPSEAHVITSHTLTGGPDTWEALPPIGRPVDNTRIQLLDRHDVPVPQGVAGEVCVAGDCLALGYLHRDDLTAERFVDDPNRPGERMYRTGDLARHRADGTLEYLGRIDHQVKVRGYRVELGEIEAALLAHPGVRETVVETRGAGAGQALVAWFVPADAEGAAGPAVAELRQHCAERLPEYMVPTVLVRLDALPLTAAGKVARRELPVPAAQERAGREPGTPTEKSVAAVFAEVLGLPQVTAEDNFFHLGGHSLAVTRAALRLSQEHGVDLTVQVLFADPTVAGVARNLDTLLWAAAGPAPADTNHDEDREEGEL